MNVSQEFANALKELIGEDSGGKAAIKTGISRAYWTDLFQGRVPSVAALTKIIEGYKSRITPELPRGLDGKRQQKMVACPGCNKKQAEERLRQIQSQISNNTYSEPGRKSVAELFTEWLKTMESSLQPATVEAYKANVFKHILPALGNYLLTKLRPPHIQSLYNELNQTYSPKTIRNIHGIIHSALNYAVDMRDIQHNPSDKLVLPRKMKPAKRILQPADVPALLELAHNTKHYIPVYICLMTGMRRGEALALRWEDYNRSKQTLLIRQSRYQITGEIDLKSPKSNKVRTVNVGDKLAAVLDTLRRQQISRASDGIFSDGGWICTNEDGSPITPKSFSSWLYRLRRTHGIDVNVHGLRHAHATYLLEQGIPTKVVSERLGHADTNITLNIYAEVLPGMQADAAARFDSLMDELESGKKGSKNG